MFRPDGPTDRHILSARASNGSEPTTPGSNKSTRGRGETPTERRIVRSADVTMRLHSEEKYGIPVRRNTTAYAGYDHLVFTIQFPVYVEVLDSISVLPGKVYLAELTVRLNVL